MYQIGNSDLTKNTIKQQIQAYTPNCRLLVFLARWIMNIDSGLEPLQVTSQDPFPGQTFLSLLEFFFLKPLPVLLMQSKGGQAAAIWAQVGNHLPKQWQVKEN